MAITSPHYWTFLFYLVWSHVRVLFCFVYIFDVRVVSSRVLGGVSVRGRQHVVLPPAGAVG